MRDEDHRQAFVRQLAQRCEQQYALRCRDRRGRLVEDEDADPQRQQAQDLELLTLPDRERTRRGIGGEAEIESNRQLFELRPRTSRVEDGVSRSAQHEVLQH